MFNPCSDSYCLFIKPAGSNVATSLLVKGKETAEGGVTFNTKHIICIKNHLSICDAAMPSSSVLVVMKIPSHQ